MAPTEVKVARPERRWGCRRGTPGLTRPGIWCFIAVPMWHHWASKG